MKIAIVGSGISGLSSALFAQLNGHEVTLFEKNSYFGGHSNTIDLNIEGVAQPVDTGFLVHNKLTYPNLIQMFEFLKVPTVESDMTLSIHHSPDQLEWCGTNLGSVFSQRKNMLSIKFWKFLFEIIKFNKKSSVYLTEALAHPHLTLGQLLDNKGYSEEIKKWYLVPMAAAIWSSPSDKILDFPAHTFIQFCLNHHLFNINDRPKWRTIPGGSRVYVKKITDLILDKYLNVNIEKIQRLQDGVEINFNGELRKFDKVIFACHADQAINLLGVQLTEEEKSILSAFKFQPNKASVHSDERLLPKIKSNWSAWNYFSFGEVSELCVSYLINKLQPLKIISPIVVTLNAPKQINLKHVHREIFYEHPLFDATAVLKQKLISNIQGKNHTYYVGAWQGYGFHEDGLKSSVELARSLSWKIPWK